MLVDKPHERRRAVELCREKADAVFKIAFARRSSRFSRQLHQPTPIITRHSRPGTSIDLGLLHPAAQRIPVNAQLLTDPATRTGHRQLQLIIGQQIID